MFNYNHTMNYFLLTEKNEDTTNKWAGLGNKANFPQVGPGNSGMFPACKSF